MTQREKIVPMGEICTARIEMRIIQRERERERERENERTIL